MRWIRVLLLLLAVQGLLLPSGASRVGAARADAAGISANVFYTASQAAYDAWSHAPGTARPARTSTFPAGVAAVAVYYEYRQARPGVDSTRIIIRDAHGTAVHAGKASPCRYATGLSMQLLRGTTSGQAYPGGRYTAELLLNGVVALRATFTVAGAAAKTTATGSPSPSRPASKSIAPTATLRSVAPTATVVPQPTFSAPVAGSVAASNAAVLRIAGYLESGNTMAFVDSLSRNARAMLRQPPQLPATAAMIGRAMRHARATTASADFVYYSMVMDGTTYTFSMVKEAGTWKLDQF